MVRAVIIVFLFIILGFGGPSFAQNMVVNPSFEEIWNCPFTMNQTRFTKFWFPFGTADPSPDFFHACTENKIVKVPGSIFGFQHARTGEAYIGMINYLTTKSGGGWRVPANHREMVMVQLTKPLVAGNQYYAEMWINLADNCEFAINSFGMYFTRDMPSFDWQAMDLGYYKPQVSSDPDIVYDNNEDWVKISGTFTAKGDELALSIGTFEADSRLVVKKTKRKFAHARNDNLPKKYQPRIAYYFIDDVKVVPIDPNESIYPEPIATEATSEEEYFGPAEVGRSFTLSNIYFEFDKSVLLYSSFMELGKLLEYLNKYKRIKIEIIGHTDNVGSREYNVKLSEARAKAVTNYLVAKGVNEFRLEYKGYGSYQPIVPNTTPQNRALNRRVEFLILEN